MRDSNRYVRRHGQADSQSTCVPPRHVRGVVNVVLPSRVDREEVRNMPMTWLWFTKWFDPFHQSSVGADLRFE